jgi:hypothetical protein
VRGDGGKPADQGSDSGFSASIDGVGAAERTDHSRSVTEVTPGWATRQESSTPASTVPGARFG